MVLYKCEQCQKEFKNKTKYTNHLRVHTGERPFQCQFCEKSFKSKSNLKDHQVLVHKDKLKELGIPRKIYQCPICKRQFSLPQHLTNHQLTHQEHKSDLKCMLCGQMIQRKKIKQHIMDQHKDFLQNELKTLNFENLNKDQIDLITIISYCPECKKYFDYPSQLLHHIKVNHIEFYLNKINVKQELVIENLFKQIENEKSPEVDFTIKTF